MALLRQFLALLILALMAGSAGAATPAEIVRKWGLIGRWAIDCAVPVQRGANNGVAYEITREGRLIYRQDPADRDRGYEVVEVTRGENNMLILHTEFPNFQKTRENGIVLQADGTLRSIYNRDEAGNYTVRDGRFVASGRETLGLHRCEEGI
ncbi:hypothetical protein QRQ56_19185 [Bradyrhizobium sp. U531]|uniref:hypothetical protein n=1 Tax=Bradyrhizobium sp. U531 TaxID=3053458 RepID=UPI003F428C87